MEFTDIAMELSKEAWQASFHHPFILQLQEGKFRTCHLSLLLDSGCLLFEGLLRSLSPLADKTSNQEMKRLLKQKCSESSGG